MNFTSGGRRSLSYGDVKEAFVAGGVLGAAATYYNPAVVGWHSAIFSFIALSICIGLSLAGWTALIALKWYDRGCGDGYREGYRRAQEDGGK